MREWQSLSHVRWYCRYHVILVPKHRKRVIFGSLRKAIGGLLRQLCEQEGIELVEGHALADHVHLCLSIPPKFSVANTVGFLKGKSAIRIHREYLGRIRWNEGPFSKMETPSTGSTLRLISDYMLTERVWSADFPRHQHST